MLWLKRFPFPFPYFLDPFNFFQNGVLVLPCLGRRWNEGLGPGTMMYDANDKEEG